MFWAIGCIGLLIFRGTNLAEEGAQEELVPFETVVALGLYTALVAVIYFMPSRR